MATGKIKLMPLMPVGFEPVRSLVTYWRNSVADDDMMGMKGDDATPITVPDFMTLGQVPSAIAHKLKEEWKKIVAAEMGLKEIDLKVVPVVVFARGYSAQHLHGMTKRGRSHTIHYTLCIPARMIEGKLEADPEGRPWIGRQFLEPNYSDSDGPIVGSLDDYDKYLDHHKIDTSSWEGVAKWSLEMHDHLSGGLNTENSFALIDGVAIAPAKQRFESGRAIRTLYEGLVVEKKLPLLLTNSWINRPAVEIDHNSRLDYMSVPRGSMSSMYALADSQAVAVIASSMTKEGDCLAINGPPGTGKTTVLQSVIATEIVQRALEGREPAIIVGCSTNNQGVMNINDAMNATVRGNTDINTIWARRWIGGCESFGLYMPSSGKVREAIAQGHLVAENRGASWAGFTERETNSDMIAEDKVAWFNGFEEVYGKRGVGDIKVAVEVIRADLHSLVWVLEDAKGRLQKYNDINETWADRTNYGEITPGEYLEQVRSYVKAKIEAQEGVVAFVADIVFKAEEALKDERGFFNYAINKSKTELESAMLRRNCLVDISKRIRVAARPEGVVEAASEFFAMLQGFASSKQVARIQAALSSEEVLEYFETVLEVNDSNAWLAHADQSVDQAVQVLGVVSRGVKALEIESKEKLEALYWELDGKRSNLKLAEGELKDVIERACEAIRACESEIAEIKEAETSVCRLYDELCDRTAPPISENKGNGTCVDVIDRLLDRTVRYELFHKSMRYWEGRWLIECEKLAKKKEPNINWHDVVLSRFKRWCMLTPCLISTIHSLPKHFQYRRKLGVDKELKYDDSYAFGDIDLLIVDEAGQVAPHIGMAAVALASKAVVVGDVHQIEPVTKITRGTDYANLTKAGLGDFWRDGFPILPSIISENEDGQAGSLMGVAQAITPFTLTGSKAPGIFLSEHRRCDADIVSYCNDLVYDGMLVPLTPERPKPVGMQAWNWAQVRGSCVKLGGSNSNQREAEAIVKWIKKRAEGEEGWLRHYNMPIDKIVAIATPFAAQSRAIKGYLNMLGGGYEKIVAGTVHKMQGAEYPIVIFSPTYTSYPSRPGRMFFDFKPNSLNVAASRAKDSFVVMGDLSLFEIGGRAPSSKMAKYLFSSPENEILDLETDFGFGDDVLKDKNTMRIATLAEHRWMLRRACEVVQPFEKLMICSPWITLNAVRADDIGTMVKEAVDRGAQVHVVLSSDEVRANLNFSPYEAIEILKGAGAVIHMIRAIHLKTLTIGTSGYVDGSFNWLSAVRDKERPNCRKESSLFIQGAVARDSIARAHEEMAALGVRF